MPSGAWPVQPRFASTRSIPWWPIATGLIAIVASTSLVLSLGSLGWKPLLAVIAAGGAIVLLKYPEVTLGCFMAVGTFKGALKLESVPVDLTVLLALLVLCVIVLQVWKSKVIPLPWELSLYVPIVLMMFVSLLYTPNLAGGIDKTLRFVVLTGVSVYAPFAILNSPLRFKRFFLTMMVAGVVASLLSLSMLGGHERLTTPGGDTIQLGHDAALGLAILWFGFMPGRRIMARLFLYVLVGVMAIALLGAGSRGPVIGLALCFVLSIVFRRLLGFRRGQIILDLGLLIAIGIASVTFIPIPQASLDYLARLGDVRSSDAFLGLRAELIRIGWRLTMEHPLGGIGINGFPVVVTGVGNWPHLIPLELSAELGVLPALSFLAFTILSLRAGLAQMFIASNHWKRAAVLISAYLIMEAVSMLNTGNINDNRQLWTSLSLPFVLRYLSSESRGIRPYTSVTWNSRER